MDNNTNANANENTDFILIDTELIHALNKIKITNGKEIMLFAKLLAMSERKGFCCPSNGYLARILCVSERNITNYIRDLEEKKVIKTEHVREGNKTIQRKLRVEEMFRKKSSTQKKCSGRNVPEEIFYPEENFRKKSSTQKDSSNKYIMSFGASQGGEEEKETKEIKNNKKTEFIDFSLLKTFEYPYSEDKELKQKRRETAYKLVTTSSITPSSSYEDKRNYYFAKNIIAYPYEPELPFKEQRADELAKGIRKWSDKDEEMFKEGIEEMEQKKKGNKNEKTE